MDPSLDQYLVYWFERITGFNMYDLQAQVRNLSSFAQTMVHSTEATVSGVVSEIEGKVVDPLIHAVEQPIANMANSLGMTASWLRMVTYVGGGWLLYAAYNQYAGPTSKRQIESMMDQRISDNNRKRRRY